MVVAFGGNAMLRASDHGTDQEQARNADRACRLIADLVRRRNDVVVVHGNGPQVGNILIQMEEAALKVPPSGVDVAVAFSQGGMGYFLERALRNQLARRGLDRSVATLVTQVEVPDDTAELEPSKPIGPFFAPHRVRSLRRRWRMAEDSGRGWRRVVPSPRPLAILNAGAVSALLDSGHVVIAGGGGGVPVRRVRQARLEGVEAVIDKDFTASLLAREIGAERLIILTSVPAIYLDYASDRQRPLGAVTAGELWRYLEDGQFAPGSMEPKVAGLLEFLDCGGDEVIVTDADNLKRALRGAAGTRVKRR